MNADRSSTICAVVERPDHYYDDDLVLNAVNDALLY